MLYALIWEGYNGRSPGATSPETGWFEGNGGGHPWMHIAGFRGCYPAQCSKIEMANNSFLLGRKYGFQIEGLGNVFLHARPIVWAWDEPETDGSPGCNTDQRYNGEWKPASFVAVPIFAILALALVCGTAYDIFIRGSE